MGKVIGIVGSRRRDSTQDYIDLREAFDRVYESGDRIVSGGCPNGGDNFAERIAREYQIPITIHYARWNSLGKGAGILRNTDIAKECDILIALVALDRTGGTEDTVKKAGKLFKKIILLEEKEIDDG
jgi:hypothetical protein